MNEAKRIIEDLIAEGFDNNQIIDAMKDGAYLESESISQEVSETVIELLEA